MQNGPEVERIQVLQAELARCREDHNTSLTQRDLLLREIQHRFKNHLQVIASLISLEAHATAQPGMKADLTDLEGRVRVIAALHDTSYISPDLRSILFGSYTEQLVSELLSFHDVDPLRAAIHVAADDVALGIEQALPLGLILNEFIANALKHAFPKHRPGVINVSLAYVPTGGPELLDDAQCELSISDDGLPAEAGQDTSTLAPARLRLIELLVSQLGGTFQAGDGPTNQIGATFRVRFPLQLDKKSSSA